MAKLSDEARQIKDRCVVDPDGFEQWLAARGWVWQKLGRGEYGVSLEEAQLRYVCEDPVLWCRAFMTEPDTGEPYQFWDYQQESIRAWDQDAVHQDGAEVGKTREIVGLVLWGQCTGFGFTITNPSILVGAPQQTHLNEIIMAIEAHVGEGEGADGKKPLINRFWRRPTKSPHYLMRWKGPRCTKGQLGLIYFRPAGYDGESFRGVHVNAMGLMDEAAKLKNKVQWSEFYRALKPGAVTRVYSVPDGDRNTEYYRMTQSAVRDLPMGRPGVRLFHWSKKLMPEPFWSDERDRQFQARYGGKDSPGYQRNVLGLHGQQENPVWPWALLESNVRDVPEYRTLKLVVDDVRGEVEAEAYSVELKQQQGKKYGERHLILERTIDLEELNDPETRRDAVRALLRDVFEPQEQAVLFGGGDLGFAKDPTELTLSREVGAELRDIARIHAKGVSYDLQCELIFCLDELFGFQAAWGIDFGNAGTAVVQMMTNYEIYQDGHYSDRMTGFQFAGAVDAIDENGEPLEEEDERGNVKPVRLPAKELATNLITARFQHRGWALPYDEDVLSDMSNHTAREGARNRIFSKENDHTIDARRAQILRKAFNESIGGADIFSSGVHRRGAA